MLNPQINIQALVQYRAETSGPVSAAPHSLPDVLAFGESGTGQLCPDETTLRPEERVSWFMFPGA